MKYLIDLKIGDKIWEVNRLEINEGEVLGLSVKTINTTKGKYDLEPNIAHIADRLNDTYNTTLCITYEDALNLCKLNCFDKIKDHLTVIKKSGSAIEAIGLRINELNDFIMNTKIIPKNE